MVSSVRGVCNFLSSVLLQQRFEMVDQCYSLVTAQSFIWQIKDTTPSKREGRPTSRGGHNLSWLSLLYICLLPTHCSHTPLSLPYANWARQEGGRFASPEALTLVPPWIFFCSIFMGFSLYLSFSLCHFGLLFPIITT